MKVLLIILGVLVGLAVLGWVGLRIKPPPLPDFPQETRAPATVPLPEDLPAPVDRFYRRVYGAEVPVIESLVVTGHGTMRVMGIRFPARFRFTHVAGQDYRHYIELTAFGMPLIRVNEHYLGGRARLELPFGVEEGSQVDQGANLGLWAETAWLPAIWLTDPRVRWEPIDEETALLIVPFGEQAQRFVARFHPDTGLLHLLESMRYKGSESGGKTLWINETLGWGLVDGYTAPTVSAATWLDEGTPWAVFTLQDIRLNVDVQDYIRARGP